MSGTALSWRQSWSDLRADVAANAGHPRSQVVMCLFRITRHARLSRNPVVGIAGRVIGAAYRVLVEWVFGIEIPWETRIGPGLRIHHGTGLTVSGNCVLGRDVLLRHGVTLGGRRTDADCPVLGDGVDVGAGAILLGDIHVGDGARVGAGAVLLQDVPPGAFAVGNPAQIRPQ